MPKAKGWLARDRATGEQAVATARSWLETPWHHQGRLKGVGVDCIGLVVGVADALGLAAAVTGPYGRRPDDRLLKRGLRLHMRRVRVIMPGDVLLFEVDGAPQHVGIASELPDGGSGVIHAHAQSRKVVEHRLGHWESRIVGVYRWPAPGSGPRQAMSCGG